MCLYIVSTARGSGWVRSLLDPSASTTYPPATAGGTDCVQVRLLGDAGKHSTTPARYDRYSQCEPDAGEERRVC